MSFGAHWSYIKAHIAERLAYRFDFILSVFGMFLGQMIGLSFILVVYSAGGGFQGWTLPEMMILQGTASLIWGICSVFFVGILWRTQEFTKDGTFDILLLKPMSALWTLIMNSFDEEDTGIALGGLTILLVGIHLAHPQGSVPLYLFFSLLGVLFFVSIMLLSSALTIIFVHTYRLFEFVDLGLRIANYPKTIYNKTMQTVFAFIVPLFIFAFYPASALLGFPLEGAIWAAASTLLFLALSLYLWHKALKHYTSSGG